MEKANQDECYASRATLLDIRETRLIYPERRNGTTFVPSLNWSR